MRRTLRLAGKDLRVLWASPVPYVVGAVFNATLALLYVSQLEVRGQALIQPMFPLAGFLLLLTLPVLTMRAFAEEARSGTLDVLAAVPVPPRVLVVGKWLAAWVTTLGVLAPTLSFVVLLYRYGDPEAGPIEAGYLGLLLMVALLAALGVLTSTLTTAQPVAAMLALFTALVLWYAHAGSEAISTGAVLERVSISERLRSFAGGAIDTGDLVFFVVMTAAVLVAAAAVLRTRRRAGGWRPALGGLALVVAFGVVGSMADRTHRIYDLTESHSLTLSEQTREVVRGIRSRVELTAFIGREESGRAEAAALLQRYQRLNRRIRFRVVDPATTPSLLRELEIDPTVTVLAAKLATRVARAPTVTETDVTSVLAQVTRNVTATLCIATGHGEADVTSESDDGLAAAGRLLENNGYKIEPLDLLVAPVVPGRCTGLLLAAPTASLGPAADAIRAYLAAAGRAIVMADPVSTVDLSPLLAPYRLSFDRGIALDPGTDAHLPDDPATLVVRRYRSSNPTVRRLPPSLYPAAQAVIVGDITGVGGLATTPLAQTGDRGYLERQPEHSGFTPAEDRLGPITLVAAADLSHVAALDKIVRSRVVAFGDSDFATNAFIATGGNARLLVQAVDWATTAEDLVPLNANLPAFRPLALTSDRTRGALVLSAGVVPGLFLLAGVAVWALRRRR